MTPSPALTARTNPTNANEKEQKELIALKICLDLASVYVGEILVNQSK